MANAWDVFVRAPPRGCRGRQSALDLVVGLGAAGFRGVGSSFFFIRTQTACCK